MKKNRNTFFQESTYQSYNPMGNPNQVPFESGSNYFYQGPTPYNYNTNMMPNDIETRLAKMERQISRLDYRVNKLENAKNIVTTEEFDVTNSNMYML